MTAVLGRATIEELRQSLMGTVITPDDEGYDAVRVVWNAMIDRRPALIVRCAGVQDVVAAVQFGRSQGLEIAVRGGGHSLPGFSTSDGGIVIDLSPMKGVRIDRARETVVAEAGLTWSDLDRETQAFGLAVTGGLISTTGVAGFTLGGGIGWLMRRYGLACDNLLAADVVTADGRIVRASERENPDLFWALRGGGGNFGIVTAFEFQLHRVGPTIAAGPIFFPGDALGEVIGAWREFCATAPDSITTLVNLTTAPPLPFLPEDWLGRRVVVLVGAFAGSIDDGLEVGNPLRTIGGKPIADLFGPMPYTAIQSLVDPLFPAGARNYFKASYLSGVPDELAAGLGSLHGPAEIPASEIHLHQMGGAVSAIPDEATAYGNRSAPFVLNIVARWTDAAADQTALDWVADVHEVARPFSTGGAYVNFMSTGDDRVRNAYGDATFARLARLKAEWDPANVFHLNQNIRPGSVIPA